MTLQINARVDSREDSRLKHAKQQTRSVELADRFHEARANEHNGPTEDEQRDEAAWSPELVSWSVVSGMDSQRTGPELLHDQGAGDLKGHIGSVEEGDGIFGLG